jgi:hypothetical protein
MAYDYHGSWDFRNTNSLAYLERVNLYCFVVGHFYITEIGHNAPLRLPVNSSMIEPELRLSVVSIASSQCFFRARILFLGFFFFLLVFFSICFSTFALHGSYQLMS